MATLDELDNLLRKHGLKVTLLRKEMLAIFLSTQTPLSAYEALDKLKVKQPHAKPISVYRVLDFFVEQGILHKIASTSQYVFCSETHSHTPQSKHHGILLLCQECQATFELLDEKFFAKIKLFFQQHHFKLKDSLIEVQGICEKCYG